jgi:hypothetical protein
MDESDLGCGAAPSDKGEELGTLTIRYSLLAGVVVAKENYR